MKMGVYNAAEQDCYSISQYAVFSHLQRKFCRSLDWPFINLFSSSLFESFNQLFSSLAVQELLIHQDILWPSSNFEPTLTRWC